jgi:TfoX/Sxy family transcriptional regulator of competence genes
VRESLVHIPSIEEKHMFGGVCFMVNDKMCIGIVKDELMCRIDPEMDEIVLERIGCRPMDFTGKRMKGFVFINEEGLKTISDYEFWLNLCLEFNPFAKASKKKVKK